MRRSGEPREPAPTPSTTLADTTRFQEDFAYFVAGAVFSGFAMVVTLLVRPAGLTAGREFRLFP